jgi:O-antigen ligase
MKDKISIFTPILNNTIYAPGFRKLAIICGVWGLAILFGLFARTSLLILSVIMVCGLIAFILISRQPAIGILALIPIAFLGYYPLPTGTYVALYASYLAIPALAVVWLLNGMLIKKRIQLVESRINLPAVLFIGVITLSFVIGNFSFFPMAMARATTFAQIGAYGLYVFSIVLMLLVGNCLPNLRWLQWMTWLFLIFCGLYMLGIIIPKYGQYIQNLFIQKNGGGTPFGSMFWTFMAAMAFGQALLNKGLNIRWRVLLGILCFVVIYFAFFRNRDWVSGWLPALIAILTIVWLRSWRWGLVITFIGGVAILYIFPDIYTSIISQTQDYSAISRTWTWSIMYEIIKVNPIFGLGPANYYYYTALFPINGYYVYFNSHNNYIDIVAQTGILGLSVFIWLIYAIARQAWQLKNKVIDPFSKAYVYACIGGLAGMLFSGLLGDWFLPFLYNIGTPGFRTSIFPWLFFGGLIALENMITKTRDSSVGDIAGSRIIPVSQEKTSL